MGKAQRIFWGVLAAVITIVAAGGVGYALAPREFLQLVLSDAAYTKYTLAKNLSSAYPAGEEMIEKVDAQQAAYKTEGAMDVTLDEGLFPSESVATEVSKYISSLALKSEIYMDGGLLKVTGDLTDSDGSVFTADAIVDTSSAYVKIDQLGTKYMDVLESPKENVDESASGNGSGASSGGGSSNGSSVGSLNETYDAIIDRGADDDVREAMYSLFETAMGSFDDTLISIISNKTLEVGSASATGDVATVVMTADDFKDCIKNTMNQLAEDKELFKQVNPCLPKDMQMTYPQFQAKVLGTADEWVAKIEESGITNVTLEFYIDKSNDIVAFEMWVMSPESSTGVKAVLFDENEEGLAIVCERDKEKTFSLDVKKDSKDANSGKIEFMNMTESGPLSISATYSGFVMSEDAFKVNLVTDKFELPGQETLGGITLDISVTIEDEALSLTARVNIDGFAKAVITLSGNEIEFKKFALPKADEIEPFDSEALQSKAIDYVLSDLPNNSASFKNVYSKVMQEMLGGFLGGLFEGFVPEINVGSDSGNISGSIQTGPIGNAISGIFDDVAGGDSAIGGFIDDLFSGFSGSYSYSYSTNKS